MASKAHHVRRLGEPPHIVGIVQSTPNNPHIVPAFCLLELRRGSTPRGSQRGARRTAARRSLVTAGAGLQQQMLDLSVRHNLGRQRGARVVEVSKSCAAARRVRAHRGDVDLHV
jgi:hypothetical protein